MFGASGTWFARGVGAWCSEGGVGNGDERARDWMGRHPDGDGRMICGDDAGYLGGVGRKEECERARPEGADQCLI